MFAITLLLRFIDYAVLYYNVTRVICIFYHLNELTHLMDEQNRVSSFSCLFYKYC